jgi:16S rRNA (uracil1498-N3)-methyltransferase
LSAPRFFVSIGGLEPGNECELPEAAMHHATRVLRLSLADAVTLFDGQGGEHAATIVAADRRRVRVRIERFVDVEREANRAVTLAMSVIAADAMDLAVRKAVELGAARIEPVLAARSQGGLRGERAGRRVLHWRHVVVAACEQCGRNRVPAIADPVPLDTWLDQAGNADVILAPGAVATLAACVAEAAPRAIVVGPEGGFAESELAQARARGLRVATLGPRVLRAETAAVAALAIADAVA